MIPVRQFPERIPELRGNAGQASLRRAAAQLFRAVRGQGDHFRDPHPVRDTAGRQVEHVPQHMPAHPDIAGAVAQRAQLIHGIQEPETGRFQVKKLRQGRQFAVLQVRAHSGRDFRFKPDPDQVARNRFVREQFRPSDFMPVPQVQAAGGPHMRFTGVFQRALRGNRAAEYVLSQDTPAPFRPQAAFRDQLGGPGQVILYPAGRLDLRVHRVLQLFVRHTRHSRIADADRFRQVQAAVLHLRPVFRKGGKRHKRQRKNQAYSFSQHGNSLHSFSLHEPLFYNHFRFRASLTAFASFDRPMPPPL